MWKNNKLLLFIVSISLVLGGCQMGQGNEESTNPSEMSKKDVPNVRALQDEFTRNFIQSTEEVEKGYYLFLSGTKQYSMLFPKEGAIHPGYSVKDNQYEGFLMSDINENGTDSQIKVNYYANESMENVKEVLEILKGRVDQPLNFEKITTENSEIHYAQFEFDPDVFGLAALIVNLNGDGSVQIVYDTQCTENKSECQAVKTEETDKMIKWIQSIKFVDKEV